MGNDNNAEVFRITMFGSFSVYCGETPIITAEDRNSKMLQIMQYLVCRRGELITPDELAETVLHGDNDSPLVAVKNLVYRLRKLFAGSADPDCLVTDRGMYGFVSHIPCEVDCEIFEGCAGVAFDESKGDEERLQVCYKALNLYKGSFLPRSAAELWTMQYSAKYEQLYVGFMREAYSVCRAAKRCDEIVDKLATACNLSRYNEELRYMYIDALNETRRVSDAIEQYSEFSRLLYDDLCVEPSDELKGLYKKVLGTLQPTAGSITEVREAFTAEDDFSGALYCTVAVFARLYHYSVRQAERTGQTVELMLCTVSENDGTQPASGERLRTLSSALRDTIKNTCRVGDAFTRNSPSQFLILLAGTTHENSEIVANRLRTAFYARKGMTKTRLNCESVPAIDAQRIITEYK